MKTLVLANQKGGVGKSAVATLLAQYLAHHGQRVLAIDLDHQGNLSSPIRLSGRAVVATVTSDQLLTGPTPVVPDGRLVLVPAGDALLVLERQPGQHAGYVQRLRAFARGVQDRFDVCVVDTNPNPDIRLIAALANGDHVLSPIQLNQEAIDGVRALLHHPRVGFHRIRAALNPGLQMMGLLPTMVESTPFQRANFLEIVQKYHPMMIRLGDGPADLAHWPRRSAIAEAQADGLLLWEMKKTSAREAWASIEPSVKRIAAILMDEGTGHAH